MRRELGDVQGRGSWREERWLFACGAREMCVLALVAFVGCVGATIYVLLPHKLVFAFRGQALLGASDHEGIDDVTEAYRAVGYLDRAVAGVEPRQDRRSFGLVCNQLWPPRSRSDPLDGQPGGLIYVHGVDQS